VLIVSLGLTTEDPGLGPTIGVAGSLGTTICTLAEVLILLPDLAALHFWLAEKLGHTSIFTGMLNVMTYIVSDSPRFVQLGASRDQLIKIQINNALRLGWSPENIRLVTNFPYTYRGVQSLVIDRWLEYCPKGNKILAANIVHSQAKEELWVHDINAFQVRPFQSLPQGCDLAAVPYRGRQKVSTGSLLVSKNGGDLLKYMLEDMHRNNEIGVLARDEEKSLNTTFSAFPNRCVRFPGRYNLRLNRLASPPEVDDLAVIHFSPHDNNQWRLALSMGAKDKEMLQLLDLMAKEIAAPITGMGKILLETAAGRVSQDYPASQLDVAGDKLEVFLEGVDYTATWVDPTLTLHHALDDHRVVGYTISGVAKLSALAQPSHPS
jgi:hypothetical protein